jgi:hypothetical protein
MLLSSTIRASIASLRSRIPGTRSLSTVVACRQSWIGMKSPSTSRSLAPCVAGRRWKSAEPVYYDDCHDEAPSEAELRKDLAVAHRLTARYSVRFDWKKENRLLFGCSLHLPNSFPVCKDGYVSMESHFLPFTRW